MSVDYGNHTLTLPDGTIYNWGESAAANCTLAVCPLALTVYGYIPSLPFSSLLLALYSLCIIIQVGLAWKYKTWTYMTVMVLGCITEIIGWAGRVLMHSNPWNHAGFIIQVVLITIGPVFFSAVIYVMISQIVNYISPKASRFPPVSFYYVFIPCDIVSLILQAIGGAKSAVSQGESQAGVDIALAGLGLQVAGTTLFLVLTVDYFIRSRNIWRRTPLPRKFKLFVNFNIAASILILIRCIYRIYELQDGYTRTSTALRDQGPFIGLEGTLVIVAAYILVLGHPGPVFYTGEKGPGASEKDEYQVGSAPNGKNLDEGYSANQHDAEVV